MEALFEAVNGTDLIPLRDLAGEVMKGHGSFAANAHAEITGSLDRIAALLLAEGRELLEDRPGLVEELRRDHAERDQERLLDMARPRAYAAFKAGEWATVVRELEPFADRLKRSEHMKLEYARRRL